VHRPAEQYIRGSLDVGLNGGRSLTLTVVTIAQLAIGPLVHAKSPSWPIENDAAGTQSVIGWAERVRLPELGVEYEARIDTGASLTSIDATIVRLVRGHNPAQPHHVLFAIDDGKGGRLMLEREIVDWVRIKNKGARGSTRRPVVMLKVCLAAKTIEGRVNLAERRGFEYPILIGRDMLVSGHFLVDPTVSFGNDAQCQK
jgi:hypothetical protein